MAIPAKCSVNGCYLSVIKDGKCAKHLPHKPLMSYSNRRFPPDARVYMGLELEVLGNNQDLLNVSPYDGHPDGSIDGVEFKLLHTQVEMPNRAATFLRTLKKAGAYVNSTCGLHVHLDNRTAPTRVCVSARTDDGDEYNPLNEWREMLANFDTESYEEARSCGDEYFVNNNTGHCLATSDPSNLMDQYGRLIPFLFITDMPTQRDIDNNAACFRAMPDRQLLRYYYGFAGYIPCQRHPGRVSEFQLALELKQRVPGLTVTRDGRFDWSVTLGEGEFERRAIANELSQSTVESVRVRLIDGLIRDQTRPNTIINHTAHAETASSGHVAYNLSTRAFAGFPPSSPQSIRQVAENYTECPPLPLSKRIPDSFLDWLRVTEPFWFSVIPPSRRSGSFVNRLDGGYGHYEWANRASGFSWEIRLHPGTVNPIKAYCWTRAWADISNLARSGKLVYPSSSNIENQKNAVLESIADPMARQYILDRYTNGGRLTTSSSRGEEGDF